MKYAKYAALLGFVLVAPGLAGDEAPESVEALARKAVALYQAGRKGEAARIFQKLAARCQSEEAGSLASFVPAAPKKAQRSEPQTSTGTWGQGEQAHRWTQVNAIYTWEDGTRVDLTISTSDQMVQAQEQMAKMFRNPEYVKMMRMNPNVQLEVSEKGPWTFITQVQKDGRSANFTAVTKGGVVSAGANRADAATLAFVKDAIDWDGLAKAVGVG